MEKVTIDLTEQLSNKIKKIIEEIENLQAKIKPVEQRISTLNIALESMISSLVLNIEDKIIPNDSTISLSEEKDQIIITYE